MLEFIAKSNRRTTRIICIGAHCDDIEIGCGGALLAWQQRKNVTIDWIVMSGSEQRRAETRDTMRALVREAARGELIFGEFPDGRFPGAYTAMKDFIESVKTRLRTLSGSAKKRS